MGTSTTFDPETSITGGTYTVTENEINTFYDAISSGSTEYVTDLLNDIMVVTVYLGYKTEYLAYTESCSQSPESKTIAVYHPCGIYD